MMIALYDHKMQSKDNLNLIYQDFDYLIEKSIQDQNEYVKNVKKMQNDITNYTNYKIK